MEIKIPLLLIGLVVAGIAVTVLATTNPMLEDGCIEPMHAFGQQQDHVSLSILSVSLLVTLACLFIKHR